MHSLLAQPWSRREAAMAPDATASLRPAELITALACVAHWVTVPQLLAVQKRYPCCVNQGAKLHLLLGPVGTVPLTCPSCQDQRGTPCSWGVPDPPCLLETMADAMWDLGGSGQCPIVWLGLWWWCQ